jgi:uncharacterized protein YqgV (UPF0045/DUF77 family)
LLLGLETSSEKRSPKDVKELIKAVKAYELAVSWHPKELEAEGGVNETVEALKTSVQWLLDKSGPTESIAGSAAGEHC